MQGRLGGMSLGRTRGKVGWGQVTEALQCMFRASHVGSEVWGVGIGDLGEPACDS